jgi:uncharacterized protein YjbI with pentapeptide repeats
MDALFNDKINAAVSDLHAQRQLTKWYRTSVQNGWEDDITRRNAAINRLEGLVNEHPSSAPRIARMLSVYVREMSREFPPVQPHGRSAAELFAWTKGLKPVRSDIQNATQALGRLQKIPSVVLKSREIDLKGANLQGFDLSGLTFETADFQNAFLEGADLNHANLKGSNFRACRLRGINLFWAQLSGADLADSQMQNANLFLCNLRRAYLVEADLENAYCDGTQMEGADFGDARLNGVILSNVLLDNSTLFSFTSFKGAAMVNMDLSSCPLEREQLAEIFGDGSVRLASKAKKNKAHRPTHWPKKTLSFRNFEIQWRAHQTSIDYDPDAPPNNRI